MRSFFPGLIGLFLVASTLSAQAEEIVCKGTDLIAGLEKSDPAEAARLKSLAEELPYANGVLWKVEKTGVKPSYVFGTMHLADPRLLDLSPKAEAALSDASTLALEITEILDPAAMAKKAMTVMQYTTYLDGTTLDDKFTPEQIALLTPRLEERAGMAWGIAKKFRPWSLMGMLAMPACEMTRKKAGKPFLDLSLGQRAKAAGKDIVALETLEGQMKVISGLPERMIVEALVQTVTMGDLMDDIFETMIARYEKGEIGLIWTMMQHVGPEGFGEKVDDAAYAEFQRSVVDERNVKMADASEELIDKGAAFIAVGALHLPGEKGLLNILAQRGYTVSRP